MSKGALSVEFSREFEIYSILFAVRAWRKTLLLIVYVLKNLMENYKKVLMRYLYRQEWRKKYVTLNEVCNMTRKGKLPSGGWRPAYYGVASISVSAVCLQACCRLCPERQQPLCRHTSRQPPAQKRLPEGYGTRKETLYSGSLPVTSGVTRVSALCHPCHP